jgi:hypothetical protein
VFRNAVPLKDPSTGETLGFEAQYVGKALLERGELDEFIASATAVPPDAAPREPQGFADSWS